MTSSIVDKLHSCCVCGGNEFIECYSAAPLDYSIGNRFPILECKSCRNYAFTLVNGDENLDCLYDGGNYDSQEGGLRKIVRPFLDVIERMKVNWLYRMTGGGRLLEIGCGKGRFMLAARAAGFDVTGIEPASRSYGFARQCLGDQVVQCDLESFSKTHSKSFDVIILWHVFEHINEPDASLAHIVKMLKEGGYLVLGVPNWNSIQARIGGPNWYHLDPPRHLHHFTPKGLETLLTKHHVIKHSVKFNHHYQNLVGDVITTLNLFSYHKNVFLNTLKRNNFYFKRYTILSRLIWLTVNIIAAAILFVPILVLFCISYLTGRSGSFCIIGKLKTNCN